MIKALLIVWAAGYFPEFKMEQMTYDQCTVVSKHLTDDGWNARCYPMEETAHEDQH